MKRERNADEPNVHCLFHKDTGTMTYIVSCPTTSATIIIDSVLDFNMAAGRTSNTHNDGSGRRTSTPTISPEPLISQKRQVPRPR